MGKGRAFLPGNKARVKVLEAINTEQLEESHGNLFPKQMCFTVNCPCPPTIFNVALEQIFLKYASMSCLKCLKLKTNKFPLLPVYNHQPTTLYHQILKKQPTAGDTDPFTIFPWPVLPGL